MKGEEEMAMFDKCFLYVVFVVFVFLATLGTIIMCKEQRRLDERLLLERHYQEVVIPMMIKEKTPFIPQMMLHHRESILTK